MRSLLPFLTLTTSLLAVPYDHDPATTEECRPRDGLPNLFAKIHAGETVRVAYLGGSITAAAGWRLKTLAWFRETFPQAPFVEINAAISGTGSDYAACRLEADVLSQRPDLVFLECRVNGGADFELPSVEGVVRQIWQRNPRTDICFIYTIGRWMLPTIQAGNNVGFGSVMERIANHYGIPSIDLGVDIAAREKAGSLIFQGNAPVEGKVVFSADGVHPGAAGHALYRDAIARSMEHLRGADSPREHALAAPLSPTCWADATLIPITRATLSAGWEAVDDGSDAVLNDDAGRTKAMLRGAMRCNRIGESITFTWNGTTLGFSDIPHGPPMAVEALIDGTKTVTIERRQNEASHMYARFFYLPALEFGKHTVQLTVKQLPADTWYYAGQLLVVGKPLVGPGN